MTLFRLNFPLLRGSPVLLALLAASSCADEVDPDRPVTHSGASAGGQTLQEGVVGTIRDEDGRPRAGASVVPTPLDEEPPPIPEIAIVSEEDGRYHWPLRPGTYQLEVTLQGYRPAAERVTVRPGEVATLDFTLTAER